MSPAPATVTRPWGQAMEKNGSGRAAVLRSRDFLGKDVVDGGGSRIGTIRDLLLDRRSGTIRYLEVGLGMLKDNVIIPVRHIDWQGKSFVLRGWNADELKRLPAYEADRPLTGETLDELALAFPRVYGDEPPPDTGPGMADPGLVPISRAKDFQIPKGEPDLRKWTVFGADGERLGIVDDLLVDPVAMKVAYLVVDVMEDLFLLKDDRHVLVPAGDADLRERGKDVWVRSLTARDVARLPAYLGGNPDPVVIDRVDEAFSRGRPPAVGESA
jgi:sporulation protein YlmC with PRC-barrel domain